MTAGAHRVNVIPTGSYRLLLCADCPWAARGVSPNAVDFVLEVHQLHPNVAAADIAAPPPLRVVP